MKVSLWVIGIACLLRTGVQADTLFAGPGSGDQWQINGGGKVQFGEGLVSFFAQTNDANPAIVTTSRFELKKARAWSLSIRDIKYAAGWNHKTAPIEIKLGGAIALRFTTWGEGGCMVIGKETIPLPLCPVTADGASIELRYDASQRQVVLRQTGGRYKQDKAISDVSVGQPKMLLDKVLDEPLPLDESVPLSVIVRSQYNGGTGKQGCQIGEIRLETQE